MFIGLLNVWTKESFNLSFASDSKGPIKCVSLNNPPCESKPRRTAIYSNESLSCPFNGTVNKCGASCNTITDPYARVRVPKKIKRTADIQVFNLTSVGNETRFLVQHE